MKIQNIKVEKAMNLITFKSKIERKPHYNKLHKKFRQILLFKIYYHWQKESENWVLHSRFSYSKK